MKELHALVIELFTAEEFRRWLSFGPDADILPELPSELAPDAALVEKALAALVRRGRIDATFFARMTTERKRKHVRIADVATLWEEADRVSSGRAHARSLHATPALEPHLPKRERSSSSASNDQRATRRTNVESSLSEPRETGHASWAHPLSIALVLVSFVIPVLIGVNRRGMPDFETSLLGAFLLGPVLTMALVLKQSIAIAGSLLAGMKMIDRLALIPVAASATAAAAGTAGMYLAERLDATDEFVAHGIVPDAHNTNLDERTGVDRHGPNADINRDQALNEPSDDPIPSTADHLDAKDELDGIVSDECPANPDETIQRDSETFVCSDSLGPDEFYGGVEDTLSRPSYQHRSNDPPSPSRTVSVVSNGRELNADAPLAVEVMFACPSGMAPIPGNGTVEGFCMDITEVTVAAYRTCVHKDACTPPEKDHGKALCNYDRVEHDNHPVNCIAARQASEYCRWVAKRLPTEDEWRWAAWGGGRKYPWGDGPPDCTRVVMFDSKPGCGTSNTWPVGSKPAGDSPAGLKDLGGNVWEWTWSSDGVRRLCGGGWSTSLAASFSRSSTLPPPARASGFRCVQPRPSPPRPRIARSQPVRPQSGWWGSGHEIAAGSLNEVEVPIALDSDDPIDPIDPIGPDDAHANGRGFGGRGTRVPTIRQARAEVQGAVGELIIRRIVDAHINEIRACYDKARARNPTIKGTVVIQFVISGTGKVPNAVVQDTDFEDLDVGNCIARAARRWIYPKPEGGGSVIVTYPFHLEPG